MKKVIILATGWKPDYWESDKEAPYPKTSYRELPEWDVLARSCPLPGLGRYYKQREDYSNNKFVYLKVTGMRFDLSSEKPYFSIKVIGQSRSESKVLENKLPSQSRRLFSSLDADTILNILDSMGEKPPEEWLGLLDVSYSAVSWRDFIGKYFIELESGNLSNNEFEDRLATLLGSLGFIIDQKGHVLVGEYPDGVALMDHELGLVYDCKNTDNFKPSAEDERAIMKYLEDERKAKNVKNLYPAFIAKSFVEWGKKNTHYFSVTPLLYLSFKKIQMGPKFSLLPMRKMLDNFQALSQDNIDKEWR